MGADIRDIDIFYKTASMPMGVRRPTDVVHKFARNPSISTTIEDVWGVGGTYVWPTVALPLQVASGGNAADDVGGAGARRIRLFGVNADCELIQEDLDLAGASASAQTEQSFLRCWRVQVIAVGTKFTSNVGDINIDQVGIGAVTTIASVTAGDGSTTLSMYTIPKGRTGYMRQVDFHVQANRRGTFQLHTHPDILAADSPKRLVTEVDGIQASYTVSYTVPLVFPERSDLWFSARLDTNTGSIGVNYDLQLL